MAQKAHGTTDKPVQQSLRWNVDRKNADRICSFNRHYAEYAGYWKTTSYLKEVSMDEPTVYYDSVSGKPLFVAPIVSAARMARTQAPLCQMSVGR